MRVAINAVHAKTGGGLTYLRNILPLLAAEPTLDLHLFAAGPTLAELGPIDPRIPVHPVRPWRGLAGLLAWEQLVLPATLRRAGIAVTFSPANYGPLCAPRTVILLRTAVGMIRRERRWTMRVYWCVLTTMTWLSLASCRRAIAVSDYARRSLTPGPFALLRRKIDLVPHGVGAPFRPDGGPGEESPPFLLAVGDIYPQKNLHTLIDAFAALRKRHPELALRIAGRNVDEFYGAELRDAVARHGLGDDVLFLGEVPPERLAELYRRCTVFVFPSTIETFGNPLVEAMASGAPVACSRAAAMPEVLGDAGVYFDPDDAESMARAIAGLLEDEAARRRCRERGLARARSFSWTEAARRTASVLARAGAA